ncbi:MAG: GTPase Era [Deltaproteobacteria bacterium]|nr:GTPase Era [Deltaproteobacteria bacterium]
MNDASGLDDFENFSSGYVVITGLPNVGKSTLLNQILHERLAIVTPKPQTTRNRILGIHNTETAQAIFVDTPGVCDEINELNKYLNKEIARALADADVVLFVVDARTPPTEAEVALAEKIASTGKPALLALNKVDAVPDKGTLLPRIEEYKDLCPFVEVFPISAMGGENVPELVEKMVALLPSGPPYYARDDLTTANMRFLVAEMIREQVFLKTQKEIPYSTAVVIDEYLEPASRDDLTRIHATIHVERDSQKGIIIGAKGSMLGEIGRAAREKIERFIDGRVFLKLHVKVSKNWSRDKKSLDHLGYN